jgi:hypothetical protein
MRFCRRVFCAVLEQHCPTVDASGHIVCSACGKHLHADPKGGWYCFGSQCTAALSKLLLLYLGMAIVYGLVVELIKRTF